MSNHRISGLADPTDADDAVTRRYVASLFQALSDEVQDKKIKLDALQNLFGVENNRVLRRKYEIIDTDFEKLHVCILVKKGEELLFCLEIIQSCQVKLTNLNLLIFYANRIFFSSI